MASKTPRVVPVASLDWPAVENDNGTILVQCAGDAFLDYELRRMELRDLRHGSSFFEAGNELDNDEDDTEDDSQPQRDFLTLSSKALQKLTYYEILGDLPLHSTGDQIKRAYHKACLKYHPDKSGRDEEDEVFLSVKAAFDTLSSVEKRKSYDSTIAFDDSIPKGDEPESDFFEVYGPVFERNLRFDARYDPSNMNGNGSSSTPGKSSKGRRKSQSKPKDDKGPPLLGNDNTPMEEVHAFYDYWVHFESWRDFSLKAQKETDNDLDSADSRYEKRWMAKEVDRKKKAYKREEMARINLLVERAMSADPRLRRERQQERAEKERLQREREEKERKEQELRKQEEERAATLQAQQEEEQRETKAKLKAEKEKEKKQLRKARQLLRKLAMSAHQHQPDAGVWDSLEEMNDDVELLCTELSAVQLGELTDALGGTEAVGNGSASSKLDANALFKVKSRALTTKKGLTEEERQAERARDEARQADAAKLREQKAARATSAWTKEELAALAKAVKKYPPGGANRWGAIALFINNSCRPENPRTKEECIEKYNQVAKSAAPAVSKQSSTVSDVSNKDDPATWTEEQDRQLQAALAKYPATMNKNERWTNIAKAVDGRTKKECVQRFKAIREAIKKK